MVLNRTYKSVPGLTAQADVYSFDSRPVFHENIDVSLAPTDVKETSSLDKILNEAKGISFIVLNLKNSSGIAISHNVYWIAHDGDYKSVNELEETTINVELLKNDKGKTNREWTFQVRNQTDRIAFFIRPQLMSSGEEILPSYWSENYFTLAPGESTIVTVTCPNAKIKSEEPVLNVSGWNVKAMEIPLKKD
jgi:hypothetical protein